MDLTTAKEFAHNAMPGLLSSLREMVAIPSIAFPGYPSEPVHAMAERTRQLFADAGVPGVRLLEIPDGYPAVYADIPGPAGTPTVLLYGHYDVQPAPLEQGWSGDPWTSWTGEDGRIYGRGAADDKSGLVIHAGTLAAFAGTYPVGIKLLIEGEEETGSHLEAFVEAHPEIVAADLFVIADLGSAEVGVPAITSSLRGDVACTITVRTMKHALHSGSFGGAAPDALVALIGMLAQLHDSDGNTIVPGLHQFEWEGAEVPAADFRASCELLDGVGLAGTGPLASRLWSRPSVTVLGMDVPSVAGSSNVLHPVAAARLSMRVVPGADAAGQLQILTDFLRSIAPWGAEVEITDEKVGLPYTVDTSGPRVGAATAALAEAFGREASVVGCGASIPLAATLMEAAPGAEIVLWGAEDTAGSRIHSSDESVDPAEIERFIVTQIRMIARLAG